jgi:hypothetical protein
MRERINIQIHEDDPILIEVMSAENIQAFTPIELDMTDRIAKREIVLGNITVRIYEP